MKKILFFGVVLLTIFSFNSVLGQPPLLSPDFYGTGSWNADSLGNHRAVINVDKPADVVLAHIPWRRRDFHPELKGIFIVEASSGKLVQNILPLQINREYGDILFQPLNGPGQYDVYFLKYKPDGKSNYPKIKYPRFSSSASPDWLSKAETAKQHLKDLPHASLVQFQSVDEFNSFYPMELIASKDEVTSLIRKNASSDYLVFSESRDHSIRMTTDLPAKWISDGPWKDFSTKAKKGEYLTFQLGIYAVKKNIRDIKISFSPLKQGGRTVVPRRGRGIAPGGYSRLVERHPSDPGDRRPLWPGFQGIHPVDGQGGV